MIPANTQSWLVAGITDMRRGHTSLSSLVQNALDKNPLSGQVFLFRGRRGDLLKVLWHDGEGMCLFIKHLDRGKFVWPQATDGVVSLTRAQLSMLCEGIDWRQPVRTWQPLPCCCISRCTRCLPTRKPRLPSSRQMRGQP